jgi:hypothetical protein
MIPAPKTELSVDDIKLASIDFWSLSEAEKEAGFAKLRAERPVSFHEEFEYPGVPKGPGFWALTRW